MKFMLTFGDSGKPIEALGETETRALRVTMGRLSRKGRFHRWQPCIFWIVNGHRLDHE